MKKIVASVGLVALGASGLQSLQAQGLSAPEPSKPWSISATLRGFYDDNINTVPDDFDLQGADRESFGFEISPSASLAMAFEQTTLSAGYTYSYKWYDQESYWETDNDSQSHIFNAALQHAFSERYRLSIADSFTIGQEPDQLRAENTFSTFQRVPGDNIRNYGNILFNADLTRNFGIELGYDNSYYNYDDSDPDVIPAFPVPIVFASYSGLLDRIEHRAHADARWRLAPATVGLVGYQFGLTDYTGDELLGYSLDGTPLVSDDRNNRSQYFYVGADHTFRPDFSGNLRVGARHNDYYNDPTGEDGFSPFVRGSVRYQYSGEGRADLGIGYDRVATDLFGVSGGDFTRDQDALTVFGSVNHRLMPKVYGSLTAQFQNSAFNGGPYDGDSEQFYLVGLNVEYRFNPHLSAHVGYNYDLLDSDLPSRDFDRNRVYIGVTAAY